MRFEAFTSPSYTPYSIIGASERTANWIIELVEATERKATYSLYRTPGLSLFCNTGYGPNCGSTNVNGRCFIVQGNRLGELSSAGVFTDWSAASGIYLSGTGLASMANNPTQLMVVSGGLGFIFTLATNTLVQITSAGFPANARGCAFQDGYFVVFQADSQQFQISALNDGLTWDPLDISSAESKPDFILAVASIHEELWMFGSDSIQPFSDNPQATIDFPFQSNQGAEIENGIAAPASLVKLDNTLFYISGDVTGNGIIARMSGYTPKRISDHAVEAAIASYPTIADAEGLGFIMNGHAMYRLTFPSANAGRGATWQYDGSTNKWTECFYWNAADGLEESHRARTAISCFGKILVGDRTNGKVYDMSMAYLSDDGDLIRRIRRAPHIVRERQRLYYQKLRFDANVGIGLDVAVGMAGYDPKMMIRWSDDAGKTWSDETGALRYIRFGRLGEFRTLPQTYGLGSARDRVYEAIVTDPVDWMIAAAYFDVSG